MRPEKPLAPPNSPLDLRSPDPRQRRDALIEAALRVIEDGGARAATTRAIAARAGVAPGLIRHYFGTRDALIREACRSGARHLRRIGVDALAGAGTDPAERLTVYIAAALRNPLAGPGWPGIWQTLAPGLRAEELSLHAGRHADLERLIAAIEPQSGPLPPAQAATACLALINGLTLEATSSREIARAATVIPLALKAVGQLLGMDLLVHGRFIPELDPESASSGPPAAPPPAG